MQLAFSAWYSTSGPLVFCTVLIFWLGAWSFFFSRRRRTCPLVHLTRRMSKTVIVNTQQFVASGPAVFALRESVFRRCETRFELMLATMLFPPAKLEDHVRVPREVTHLFKLMIPVGPRTAIQSLFGVHYAPYPVVRFAFPFTDTRSRRREIFKVVYMIDTPATAVMLLVVSVKIYIIVTQFLLERGWN